MFVGDDTSHVFKFMLSQILFNLTGQNLSTLVYGGCGDLRCEGDKNWDGLERL